MEISLAILQNGSRKFKSVIHHQWLGSMQTMLHNSTEKVNWNRKGKSHTWMQTSKKKFKKILLTSLKLLLVICSWHSAFDTKLTFHSGLHWVWGVKTSISLCSLSLSCIPQGDVGSLLKYSMNQKHSKELQVPTSPPTRLHMFSPSSHFCCHYMNGAAKNIFSKKGRSRMNWAFLDPEAQKSLSYFGFTCSVVWSMGQIAKL